MISTNNQKFASGVSRRQINFSRDLGEYISNVWMVILLQRAGMKLNINRWKLLTHKSDYIGHMIRPGKLEMASRTTYAIGRLPLPKSVTKLKNFWVQKTFAVDLSRNLQELEHF